MDMKLKIVPENQESISTHISVPCSPLMHSELKDLKKRFGKSVNEKIRQAIQNIIKENCEDKKAS